MVSGSATVKSGLESRCAGTCQSALAVDEKDVAPV
jgi:hypothetical protein